MHQLKREWIWVVLIIICSKASAQPYGNEWIDYSKTYYRFQVTPNISPMPGDAGNHDDPGDYGSFYKIPYAQLAALGLASTPVEHFKLLRKGVEVPMRTFPATGVMGTNGYLEFWATPNDGKAETNIYRDPTDQLSDRWSLFSDSLWYYLTTNSSSANLRIVDQANVINTQHPVISSINHTLSVDFRAYKAKGFERIVSGKSLQSSAFDSGEGWARFVSTQYTFTLPNINADLIQNGTYNLSFAYAGTADFVRSVTCKVNGNTVWTKGNHARYTDEKVTVSNLPNTQLNAANNDINFSVSQTGITLHQVKMQYLRKLTFSGNENAFVFEMPANNAATRLKIVRFNTTAGSQYLIDFTNGRRYEGVRVNDTTWFALPVLAQPAKMLLHVASSQLSSRYQKDVSTLQPRQFLPLNNPANRGDYLIVSNSNLYNANGSNPVAAYASLRNSAIGGSYNSKVYNVEELYEQFAGGVPQSPLALRQFSRYAFEQFSPKPKYFFIIGHGLTYRETQNNTFSNQLNLVPTWGDPASDNVITAFYTTQVMPQIPVGRLSAVNGLEVKGYLDKMIRFLQNQQGQNDKQWQKETLHLIGGTDAAIISSLENTMNNYKAIVADTFVGANVLTVKRLNDPNTSENNQKIKQRIESGAGFISYFGHSSATSFDFNLNDPDALSYTEGRYSTLLANGCNASEFYNYDEQRLGGNVLSLSEKWVLYPNGGTVSFLSSSTYGVLQHLTRFSDLWYKNLSYFKYGNSIGIIHQRAIDSSYKRYGVNDDEFNYRRTAEQFVIHGDPAIIIHTQTLADYAIDEANSSVTNPVISATTDSLKIKLRLVNNGKVNAKDTVTIVGYRNYPGGKRELVWSTIVTNITGNRVLESSIAVKGIDGAGLNNVEFIIDPNDQLIETTKDNNSLQLPFTVDATLVKAGYPANFSIVNAWPTPLYAFSGHVKETMSEYRLQLDTTMLFNSPLLYQLTVQQAAGTLKFTPANTLQAGKVYYWRVAKVIGNGYGTWSSSSFTYLPGNSEGFNQAHYFQWLQNDFDQLQLKGDRKLALDSGANNLYVSHGIFPTSGDEDSHFSISRNGQQDIQSACIGSSIIFNVFDSTSFIPWKNNSAPNGLYNSTNSFCAPSRQYNFEYSVTSTATRKHAMDFIDLVVPNGHFVTARLVVDQPYSNMNTLSWAADTATYGSGNSLYHSLKRQGFTEIDSANGPRTFSFIFKKNNANSFTPVYRYSEGLFDRPVFDADLPMPDTIGTMQTQLIGPASAWNRIQWQHVANSLNTDITTLQVYGVKPDGVTNKLFTLAENKADTILPLLPTPAINAATYPYLQLKFETRDKEKAKPGETALLRVDYAPLPEGAVVPQEYFTFNGISGARAETDVVARTGGPVIFGIAFRNISTKNFADSLPVIVQIEDDFGNKKTVSAFKVRPLAAGDSSAINVSFAVDTLLGAYKLYVAFNQTRLVPEVQVDNNFLYHDFIVTNAITGIKYYNGSGPWSAANNWSPAGIPTCTDKVVINGQVTVDVQNAVADSLAINPGGALVMSTMANTLTVGCNTAVPDALLLLRGGLNISGGTIKVNGAMFVANGSQFSQSGGNIVLNANNGTSTAGINYISTNSNATGIPAIFSIGGRATSDPIYGAYSNGSISASGGNIFIINPAPNTTGKAMHVRSTIPVLMSANHTLQFGADSTLSTMGNANGFSLFIDGSALQPTLQLGTLIINNGGLPSRKFWLTGTSGSVLNIRKKLEAKTNATIEMDKQITVNLLTEQ